MIPATGRHCFRCGQTLPRAAPALPAAAAHLLVQAGPERGKTFTIEAKTRIGRGADNDVELSDPKASRRHCRITCQGNQYVLVDLGSSHGTFVNNVCIQENYVLKEGDVIKLGDTEVVFHL